MNAAKILGRAHAFLSSSPRAVRAAVKIRNQANAIVATHFSRLSVSTDAGLNGENALARHIAPHVRAFVDVGGNRGDWTAHLLQHAGNAPFGLVFEPNEGCRRILQVRFSNSPGVEIVGAAVSDYAGQTEFFESGADSQLSSLDLANAGENATRHVVPVVTLDEELASRGWDRVTLVKIDTEGNDYFVLRGARSLLERRRIDVLQFECNHTWGAAGTTLRGAVNLLRSHGYRVCHLRPEGLFDVDFEFFGHEFGYGNWVGFHEDAAGMVRALLRQGR